jgi:hypothetical protein
MPLAQVNPSGIHATDATDAQIIRDRCHLRLIQPEWVSSNGNIMMNWIVAETKARLGVIAFFWLWLVACAIRFEECGSENNDANQ